MARQLPNELLIKITEFVSEEDSAQRRLDLKSLRLVSTLFRDIVTPALFSTIHFARCLEDAIEQTAGLVEAPELVAYIREINIPDESIFAFDRTAFMKKEGNVLGDTEDLEQRATRENITARYLAGEIAWKECNALSLIDVRTPSMFSTAFTLSFWPLLSLCSENIISLRLLHTTGFEDADFFAMVLFNTLEKFRLPKLKTLEIQMFDVINLRNLAGLIPDPREQHGEPITALGMGFDRHKYRWNMSTLQSNISQIRNLSISSLRSYHSQEQFYTDRGIHAIGRKIFGHIAHLETLKFDDFGGIFTFRYLVEKLEYCVFTYLTSFTFINGREIYGGDLKGVLETLDALKYLVLENIDLHLPDPETIRFVIEKIPTWFPAWHLCLWFEILGQSYNKLKQLRYFRFHRLGYYWPNEPRDEDRNMVTAYKIYSKLEPGLGEDSYLLSSMYTEDYQALVEFRDTVLKTRKEMEEEDIRAEEGDVPEIYWHDSIGWV